MSRGLGLARAVGGRIAAFVAALLGAVVLVQTLLAFAPGDAIDALPNADEVRPVLEREWGLDRPFPLQVTAYVADAARGDLRTSIAYQPGRRVTDVIAGPALRSLGLVAAATALCIAWGLALAWFGRGRRAVRAVSIVPAFLLAHLAVEAVNGATWWAMGSGLIGRPGWFALPVEGHPVRDALAVVLLAVGSGALADVTDEIGHALQRIRDSGYVDAARARGRPTWPHVALNLVGPLTTVIGNRAAFFVGELVILEKVMLLPGLGSLLWQSALLRDYPLALGITLVTAAAVCAVRLAGDVLRIGVDPRLRTEVAP